MAAAAATRWRDGAGRDWLFGGAGNDLLSGDAPASLWQDRPFITFSNVEFLQFDDVVLSTSPDHPS